MFNPQNLNRYSYVRNNPIRYADPSGHNPACGPDGVFCSNNFEEAYGISFGEGWSDTKDSQRAQRAVGTAVRKVARKFAAEMELDNPAMAFFFVFGRVHFQWGNCGACNGSGGYAYGYQEKEGYHLIAFESITGIRYDDTMERGVKNVVHELGHIYNQIRGRGPSNDLDINRSDLRTNRGLFLRPNDPANRWDWQQHPPEMSINGWSGSETFADMFIAWTYDAWNTNASAENVLAVNQAQTWMSQWMP